MNSVEVCTFCHSRLQILLPRVLCTLGSTIGWELSASQLLRGRPGATKDLGIRLRELEFLLRKKDIKEIFSNIVIF